MSDNAAATPGNDPILNQIHHNHIQRLTESDSRCRALQLPEGIMLRYNLTESLFFYLRTAVREGKIMTRIFASDSPYDPQRTAIGEVSTPMFETQADDVHLEKVKGMLYAWVDFVSQAPESGEDFQSFSMPFRRIE